MSTKGSVTIQCADNGYILTVHRQAGWGMRPEKVESVFIADTVVTIAAMLPSILNEPTPTLDGPTHAKNKPKEGNGGEWTKGKGVW